jgi:hypothetical protein
MSKLKHFAFQCSIAILLLWTQPAGAKTIDTFDFVQNDYVWKLTPLFVTFNLTGSFTGVVEPDGSIQQKDLTDFKADALFEPFQPDIVLTKGNLSLFSYNTTGGPGSLDFVAFTPTIPVILCVGASVALDPACLVAGGAVPVYANGKLFLTSPFLYYTGDVPEITLVSSVTSIPEVSTWTMLITAFGGWVAFAGRARLSSASPKLRA